LLLGVESCDPIGAPDAFQCFTILDPYVGGGSWSRGNFHMHSRHSDGAYAAVDLARQYAAEGYAVLCISDHNSYGDQDGGIAAGLQTDSTVHDWNGDGRLHAERRFGSGVEAYVQDWTRPTPPWSVETWLQPGGFEEDAAPVVIPGAEITRGGDHVLVIGHPPGPIEAPNSDLRALARARAAGGFVVLAHPGAWNRDPTRLPRTLDLGLFDALEIMNGLELQKGAEADATPLWDALLASGVRLWGMANDDSHTWVGAGEAEPFTAYNWILTAQPTQAGYLQALHRGAFYGSTGLRFEVLGVADGVVQVVAPGAETLRFIGAWGRVLFEAHGESAGYAIQGTEGYVRVEAVGDALDGAAAAPSAWSQPFYIENAACDAPGSRRVE
jgi:hypothetical protein